MARHFLKIWPEHFQPVHDGLKKAEIRKDDREPAFARLDELVLQEWDADDGEFTGREVAFLVSHALRGGLVPKGYAMLSGDRLKCSCCDGWTYMPLPSPHVHGPQCNDGPCNEGGEPCSVGPDCEQHGNLDGAA